MVNFVFYNHDFGYNIDKSNWGATLMLCVVNFVSLVVGHFLLEGHGGMVFRTTEHKHSIYYILAFAYYSISLSVVSSKVGL